MEEGDLVREYETVVDTQTVQHIWSSDFRSDKENLGRE